MLLLFTILFDPYVAFLSFYEALLCSLTLSEPKEEVQFAILPRPHRKDHAATPTPARDQGYGFSPFFLRMSSTLIFYQAGVLKPKAARILVGAIREKYPDLPIHVHTHGKNLVQTFQDSILTDCRLCWNWCRFDGCLC